MKILFILCFLAVSFLQLNADDDINQSYAPPPPQGDYNSNPESQQQTNNNFPGSSNAPSGSEDKLKPANSAPTVTTPMVLYDIKTTHGSIMIKKMPDKADSPRTDSQKRQIDSPTNAPQNNKK